MYCPEHFREARPEVMVAHIERHRLATVVSAAAHGLGADHIPLMHVPVAGTLGTLVGHVARSNPLWQAPPGREHLLVFQGPSAYISPNWYATKRETGKVVPTWNYAVVHVHATLTARLERAEILSIVTRLTQRQEAEQPRPWQVGDAPADYIDKMLASIVGVEFAITRMQGKWKVSQNQPPANRQSVFEALRAGDTEAGEAMAKLVRQFGATPEA